MAKFLEFFCYSNFTWNWVCKITICTIVHTRPKLVILTILESLKFCYTVSVVGLGSTTHKFMRRKLVGNYLELATLTAKYPFKYEIEEFEVWILLLLLALKLSKGNTTTLQYVSGKEVYQDGGRISQSIHPNRILCCWRLTTY